MLSEGTQSENKKSLLITNDYEEIKLSKMLYTSVCGKKLAVKSNIG